MPAVFLIFIVLIVELRQSNVRWYEANDIEAIVLDGDRQASKKRKVAATVF